ncbi:Dimer Tnp hAT domain-containing protein [Abeliophyllum distichum]|uniref:Dimer Tnp hAT domain-containing protein n=1 Tax=Abeliophyllum distichum TaxID=126358 RepID=A0ABD1TJF2_9LAMI
MYKVYAEKTGRNVIQPPIPTHVSSSLDDNDLWSYLSLVRGSQYDIGSSFAFSLYCSSDIPLELARYFAHDMLNILDDEERNYFDILQWWRQNERQYPILSNMACDLLTPPVSTVASESALSTCGRVLSDFRNKV